MAIEGALKRIESGDYGYCYACGEEISFARLSFDSTITRCVDCAS
ncbi:TraR/DksA family transcriptional regulator [Microbulbifer rhizosphaerae]